MPALRGALTDAGYRNPRTYVQSGNLVLEAKTSPGALAAGVRELIKDRFGLDIAVVVRTRDELAEVVSRNPLSDVVTDPKRYQVTFLQDELSQATIERLTALSLPDERFVSIGRELYAWHPAGVARSKLWPALASDKQATARNWTTVTNLLGLADE